MACQTAKDTNSIARTPWSILQLLYFMGIFVRINDVTPRIDIKHQAMIPSTTPKFIVDSMLLKASMGDTPASKKRGITIYSGWKSSTATNV